MSTGPALTRQEMLDFPPFVARQETSREAAEAIAPRVEALERRVLEAIARLGHLATCDQVVVATGSRQNSTSARIHTLAGQRKGSAHQEVPLLARTGVRRETSSGRRAFCYRTTKACRALLARHQED